MTTKPGVRGPRACLPHTVDPMIISASTDYRAAAQRRLPPFLFHYIDGGAYAEHTLKRNVSDLSDIALLEGEALLVDSENTLVMGSTRLITGIGLKDLIIVDTPDALMVCDLNSAGQVRELVKMLKEQGRQDLV